MQLNYSLRGKKLGPHCHTLAGSYLSKRPAHWKLVWENSVALVLCIREMRIKEKKTQIAIRNNFSTLLEHVAGTVRAPKKNYS